MYGVVLWSDSKQDKALIWCEDHQNLAFFKRDHNAQGATRFVPGDLVEFDLREENELRLAVDPCIVAPHEYPSLAADLRSATNGLRREPITMPRPESRRPEASGRVVRLYPNAAAAPRVRAALSCG